MKKISLLILALSLIIGCATNEYTTNGQMAGPETRITFKAYQEMCARNPLQVLCVDVEEQDNE